MLGSMFVGLLVGFLAGAMTNRGERMGCFGKMFLGWIGAFLGHLFRSHDCFSYFLETRKLIS